MFGAADPEQAISQLEAYYREGRGERAEVMASALVDQLMAKKDRAIAPMQPTHTIPPDARTASFFA